MPGYRNFAVIGAGVIGGPIIEEFLNLKSAGAVDKVVLLTRPGSAAKHEAASRGATIAPVDYSSTSEVSKALAGVEVVISTLNHAVLSLQIPIAEAAKAAGVQLFVPSEFGSPTEEATEGSGVHSAKGAGNKRIRELGLPTALFFTGGFSDYIWVPSLNLDVKSGSVGVGGDGNTPASYTSRPDIARYVAYVLTTPLPPTETKNRAFNIEGERTTFYKIFAAYENKHWVRLQVRYTPVKEFEENAKKGDIVSALHLFAATGKSAVGTPLDNGLFPNWNPKPVIDYL